MAQSSSYPEPHPEPPTRATVGVRNLLAAMVPLIVVVGALVAFAGQCSVSPGRPSTDAAVAPSVDADAELSRFAGSVDFPVRVPDVPGDWGASTADRATVESGEPVVRTGWLVADGGYAQLSQSPASEPDLVAVTVGGEVPAPTGAVDIDGRTWVAYPGLRSEVAWVADLGDVRLLVTGSANDDALRTLAAAAQSAAPIS